MFGLSGSEAVFWLLLALVVIGPTNLPRAARAVRDFVAAFRQALDTIRAGADREVTESLRASGLAELSPAGLEQYLTGDTTEFVPTPPPPPAGPEPAGEGATDTSARTEGA